MLLIVQLNFFVNNNGVGIAYGNDLLQSEKLPTAVCMTSNIIDALDYIVPPQLQHMYADNFWKDLGICTKIIKYFPKPNSFDKIDKFFLSSIFVCNRVIKPSSS
jgi:hypothetical protein